jgi:ribosomal protein L37E
MAMKSQTQRTLLFCFLASIAACGALGVYCLLLGNMGPLEARILGSTALVGAASILGLIGVMTWEQRRWHPMGMLGVIFAAIALLLSLTIIWASELGFRWLETNEDLLKSLGVAWVLAVALPHISLLSFARLHAQYLWVRRMTIIAIGFLAALVIHTILTEGDGGDMVVRLIGIFAIADVCGTIAMPILHRVSAIRTRESYRTTDLQLSLTCPRCDTTQDLSVGRSNCTKCGLKFVIDIEEQLCPHCGYALYKLESANCPECGQAVLNRPENTSAAH